MEEVARVHPERLAEHLRRVVRTRGAEVVHLGQSGLGFLAAPARQEGARVVLTVHANDLLRPWLGTGPAHRDKLRQWFAQVDRVTAVSRFSRDQSLAAGAREPLAVVPCAIDPGFFLPGDPIRARRALNLPLDRPILLSVGRLVPRKGFAEVVQVLPRLREWNPLHVIVGIGQEERALHEQIHSLGLENECILLGELDDDAKLLAYQAADLFVLPTLERHDEQGHDVEGFGIVYLEAAACGLPCVATHAGGVADAVADEVTGLLVAPRDSAALAEALIQLLRKPDRARTLGAAGRDRVLHGFTRNHLIQHMERVYREALDAMVPPA
jgi:phosphatidylinositol alpha-1,6-mannosyltransferase